MGSEDVPQPKTSEELVKELTLSEEILEQIVAQVGGTAVDATDIPVPPPPEEEVRSKVEKKTLEEEPKELEVAFPDFVQDSVVPLLKYLDKKREKYIVRKESGSYKVTVELCERLEASKGAYAAEVQRVEEMVVAAAKRDQLHAKELAKVEERRVEEE
ncbi:hypothetical protein AXG93_3671s1320 [Marchantia polymorpha subsp. ruderalis]|uniref:Uncharacterized protein n=1 Tax=Marchantia polymorpha subsp. ruderalis TaxID=1480154 RepID=A0A176WIE3_MARPO|nr:hypothetical protein AXG93_3671s1320 [Marchantia polymorpha subsp. ruderalis]